MQPDHSLWPVWSRFLQRGGLRDWVPFLLEGGGPLTALVAQLFYLGQPFLSRGGAPDHLLALAQLLEDKEESRSFADFLREEKIQ